MEKIIKTLACAILATAVTISQSMAREGDQISIVGSSTVFPFSTIVAERFAKNTDFKAQSLIHNTEPTRPTGESRMPSSA